MTPQRLLANTLINFWSFQNSGLPVSVSRETIFGRVIYRVTVWNVPTGSLVFTNVRNNHNGVLRESNRVWITNPNGTYFLNRLSFY